MVWEVIFLLVILKIPVVYLCWVVWWAIRAEPGPPTEPAIVSAPVGDGPELGPNPRHAWRYQPRRRGPHGSPRPVRAHRSSHALASRQDQGSGFGLTLTE